MSIGKMNTVIVILKEEISIDKEGFSSKKYTTIAAVKAYFEQKNSTEKWTNLSLDNNVNALFRLRYIKGLTTKHFILCNNRKYNIYSIENIKNRNMYLEILGVCDDGNSSIQDA